ncbi:sensor domain-containing diguanylate cyclase [Syntrophomonas palmitatica]|uniref:sensor domain-containing diguanylate cyclase n=1 Tax=Syntrophomonas palmitatica TaxID=402877 RepID=UPI0006CFA9E8|nr:GGDEF domain-containing protein [Syntrophomonas palmitatica]
MMTITTLDEGKYIDINESCLRTMEFEREEVIGRTTEELGIYADAKQRDVILNLLLAKGSIRDIEVNFRSKNGKIIIGLMSADILRIDTKDYLLTMVTDITERRLMEKELEEKNQRLQELNQKLKMQTITDDLTGIYNHRYIFQCLQQELRRAKRYKHPLTVMMLDLDHFKLVNDRWGHQVGDHVLKSVARIIASNLRETDMVGRYGGEEFLVILPMTDIKDGLQVAERIRKEVQEASFSQKGLKVTISIGAAQYNGDKLDKLIGRADSLLYQAKNNGRNRVEY